MGWGGRGGSLQILIPQISSINIGQCHSRYLSKHIHIYKAGGKIERRKVEGWEEGKEGG